MLGPISGAHFNPAVTIARWFSDTFAGIHIADMPAFIGAQIVGAICAAVCLQLAAGRTRAAGRSRSRAC
jgi:glycerol uptake facilitator-like aquaporin